MSTIFTAVSSTPQDFSTFDLSHQRKMTLKPGLLVPILLEEVVPGDRFQISHSQIVRAQPMLAPIMHEVNVKTYFFFVPNRILFDEKFGSDKTNPWVQFIRGGESGTDAMPLPYLDSVDPVDCNDNGLSANGNSEFAQCLFKTSTLWDYLGLPAATNELEEYFEPSPQTKRLTLPDVQLLPFMAYHKIWNDYFRYESIQPEFDFLEKVNIGSNDTDHLINDIDFWRKFFSLKRKAWEHDMFTSALPNPQRGAPVTLPIMGQAPLMYDGQLGPTLARAEGINFNAGDTIALDAGPSSLLMIDDPLDQKNANIDVTPNHYVDLTQAVATTIQDLRKAVKLQEWLELGMRAGTRYFEFIKAYSNVNVKDERLQRAEFIGGATSNVIVSEVVQQSETQTTPLGEMAGHGLNIGGSDGIFTKFVEEYGYIVGLACIIPRTAYQNTVPKHFLKKDKFDIFTPQFQHVGEQALTNQEVNYNWYTTQHELNEDTFGYIPRYTEYKFHNSSVHGDFTDSLNYWVWNRKFSQLETIGLNASFIEANPSRDIFSYIDENTDPFLMHLNFRVTAKRQMNYLGEPKFA